MKSDLIVEVAFLYLSNPRYWTRDRICKTYGLKPHNLEKMMLSPHWQRVERVVRLNEQVKQQTADLFFKQDHFQKTEKYHESRLNLGGIQASMTLRLGKLLMRAVMVLEDLSDEELLDNMKDYSQSIGSYTKAFCLLDDQSMKNSNLALAIETILENIPDPEPKQLELFP